MNYKVRKNYVTMNNLDGWQRLISIPFSNFENLTRKTKTKQKAYNRSHRNSLGFD